MPSAICEGLLPILPKRARRSTNWDFRTCKRQVLGWRSSSSSGRYTTEDGWIDLDAVVLGHQLAELQPLGHARRLVGAMQALAQALELLGHGAVHIHSEPEIEPANRGAIDTAVDPDRAAVGADLNFMHCFGHGLVQRL